MKPYAVGTDEARHSLQARLEDARTLDKQDMYRRHGSVLGVLQLALQFISEDVRSDFEAFVLEYREHFQELHTYVNREGEHVRCAFLPCPPYEHLYRVASEDEPLAQPAIVYREGRDGTRHNHHCAPPSKQSQFHDWLILLEAY